MEELRDVQREEPNFHLKIDKTGVKGIRIPIKVLDKRKKIQHTVAIIDSYVCLPDSQRGTHMSRFSEFIHLNRGVLTLQNIKKALFRLKKNLEAKEAFLIVHFPYFIEKKAPITKLKSLMSYDVIYEASLRKNHFDFKMSVKIPVMTLCPCSKSISKFNAHNQRAYITITMKTLHFFWLEDIIKIAESSASSELYTTLKRKDEKYVTEYSYEHPKFVEDVARETAEKLKNLRKIDYFKVEVESMESIHNHSAYAMIEYEKSNRHRH